MLVDKNVHQSRIYMWEKTRDNYCSQSVYVCVHVHDFVSAISRERKAFQVKYKILLMYKEL